MELVIGEVLHDVGVEAENAELMRAHNARKKLHDENLMVKQEAFVVAVEDVVESLAERLRVVEELNSREVGGHCNGFSFLSLRRDG